MAGADKLLVIFVFQLENWLQRYDAGHITQWSTSIASLEATGCRHWVSHCAVLPRRPPWLTNSNETQKTNKKHFLASNYHPFFQTE
jgi:hypothetical protein